MRRAHIAVASFVTLICSSVCADQTNNDTKSVIAAIRSSERKLLHIAVSGDASAERFDSQSGKWVYNGEWQFHAWYAGMPGSKAKIDFTKRVMPSGTDNTTFVTASTVFAYNGRIGQLLQRSRNGRPLLRGAIEADRSNAITLDGIATGWSMSLYGAVEEERRSLSDLLSQWQNTGLSIERSKCQGKPCIKVNLRQASMTRCWFLDPAREYAVLGHEAYSGKTLRARISVDELTEAAPGVFYPKAVTIELFRESAGPDGTGPVARTRLSIANAVANATDFDDEVFSIQWPNGSVIDDRIAKTVIRIGHSPRDLDQAIGQQAREVQKTLAMPDTSTQPETVDGMLDEVSRKTAVRDEKKNSVPGPRSVLRSPIVWLGGIILVLAATCLLAIWILRRRHKKALGILLCICMFLSMADALTGEGPSSAPSATNLPMLDELRDHKVYNCGLYATVFVLKTFGRDVDIQAIAGDLEIGERWERPTTLSQVARSLESKGLTTAGFKEASVDDVVARLGDMETAAIVHAKGRNGEPGHFYVLLAARDGQTCIIDPGVRYRLTDHSGLARLLEGRLTGYGLFVHAQKRPSMETIYDLSKDRLSIDLGDIRPGVGDLVIAITVANPTPRPIRVARWTGNCNCVKSVRVLGSGDGNDQVPSGGRARMEVVFDRARIGVGRIDRSIALYVREQRDRTVIMQVRGQVDRALAPYMWIPETIDFGVARGTSEIHRPQRVKLVLPLGVRIASTSSASNSIRVEKIRESNLGPGARVLHEYEIGITETPVGDLDDEVVFETTADDLPRIVIPVRGRVADDVVVGVPNPNASRLVGRTSEPVTQLGTGTEVRNLAEDLRSLDRELDAERINGAREIRPRVVPLGGKTALTKEHLSQATGPASQPVSQPVNGASP